MKVSFSVIITTFNRKDLLLQAIESVQSQSYKAKEIILINNNKNNLNFIKKNQNLKVFNMKKNIGIARARNIGVQKSKFNYVAFLDDDDIWHKNYLKQSKKNIENNINYKIFLTKKIFFKNNKQIFKKINKLFFYDILTFNPGIIGSNIIFEKKTFEAIGGYDHKLIPSEDKGIIIDAIIKKKKIFIQDNFIFYNNNNANKLSKNYLKLLNGKFFFIKKYYSYMSIKILFKNIIILLIYIIKFFFKLK